MNFLKISLSNAIIACVLIYVGANITIDGANHGIGYLAISLVLFIMLQTVAIKIKTLSVSKSLLIVLIFVAWASIKTMFDTMSIQEVKSITTSSTGGLLYFMLIGIMCSRALSFINTRIVGKSVFYEQQIFMAAMIWIALFVNYNNFIELLGGVRVDLFLIEEQEGFYQRFASYLIIQNIICGYFVAMLSNGRGKIEAVIFIFALLGFVLGSIVLMVKSQLVGSNSAFAFALGYLLVVLFYVYFNRANSGAYRLNEKNANVISKSVVKNALRFLLLSFVLAILVINYLVDSARINLDVFRIAGFGESEVSSVNSRLEIIADNFLFHMMHSPLFGNTQVDKLTTGEGTYIHSTLSILTHLGLLGFVVFMFAIYKIYEYIDLSKYAMRKTTFDGSSIVLFNKLLFIYVLLVGFMIAFYTWAPLWFILGFFSVKLFEKE
jgi:hypothetical protein